MSWIPEAELPNDIAKLREELRAALMESARPIRSQASCAWCEKDEIYVPMQDCVDCQYNHIGSKDIYCRWDPGEKVCEGCGIPAEYCEPETYELLRVIKKAAM